MKGVILKRKRLILTYFIASIDSPKESIKQLLELISEFSKVAEYKAGIIKSILFLYSTNNKKWHFKNIIKVALENIKYLEIN